ncbi:hypothetical protein ACLWBD_13420 [Bdellovibrio sp. HCB117]|uniref:Ig-like domain-containing protein n=1 Tax=Bdellovibrio sp. HCB117 TaxID=3394359 RepID=UPI0039B53BCF
MKYLIPFLLSMALSTPAFAQDVNDKTSNEETFEIVLGEQGDVEAQTRHFYYNFGRTYLNQTKSARFYIRNTGGLPIYFNDFDISGNGFWYNENCPRLLFSGQRCSVRVYFRPNYIGNFNGRLDIEMTGAEDIRIHLRGRGIWPF